MARLEGFEKKETRERFWEKKSKILGFLLITVFTKWGVAIFETEYEGVHLVGIRFSDSDGVKNPVPEVISPEEI